MQTGQIGWARAPIMLGGLCALLLPWTIGCGGGSFVTAPSCQPPVTASAKHRSQYGDDAAMAIRDVERPEIRSGEAPSPLHVLPDVPPTPQPQWDEPQAVHLEEQPAQDDAEPTSPSAGTAAPIVPRSDSPGEKPVNEPMNEPAPGTPAPAGSQPTVPPDAGPGPVTTLERGASGWMQVATSPGHWCGRWKNWRPLTRLRSCKLRCCLGPLFCRQIPPDAHAFAEAQLQPPFARFHPVPTAPVFLSHYDDQPPQLMRVPVQEPRRFPHALGDYPSDLPPTDAGF